MNKLQEAIKGAIPIIEKRKPVVEVTDEVLAKVTKAGLAYLKSQEAKNALIDGFADWFEYTGKKQAGIKEDDYTMDDLEAIMDIVKGQVDKVIK